MMKYFAKVIHFDKFSNIMLRLSLFFALIMPLFCYSQINESFTDGDFIENPTWKGIDSNFKINTGLQLQSTAQTTSTSFLFTASESFDNASWECWIKITYPTSSSNFASFYIVSDKEDISSGFSGYFIQVGGTNDEVSLYLQEGTKKTKLIDGKDKRTDGTSLELKIKVTRDILGNLELFSKLATESEYISEGKVKDNKIKKSSFTGILFSNTTTTGNAYYFDDIIVAGNKAIDNEAPKCTGLKLELPNKIHLDFSEVINNSDAQFFVDNGIGKPELIIISKEKIRLTLSFKKIFEKGILYNLDINGLKDESGNKLDSLIAFGIIETKDFGDLVLNEIMFENNENSEEYIEIFNNSDKVLDISDIIFTTRKTDGNLNSGSKISKQYLMSPLSYLAITKDAEKLRLFHSCPALSNILSTNWNTLNNETSTIVICNEAGDSIYDELIYNTKWHNILVKNPKGVALEKLHPKLPTQDANSWHSAASDVNYGTPGYKNSQYINIENQVVENKSFWLEPAAFSPNNDGYNDVCMIKYKLDTPDNVAKIQILNSSGVKTAQLANNSILSTDGVMLWDGVTIDGKTANPGIYVVYIELFNPKNGFKKQYKFPLVVHLK